MRPQGEDVKRAGYTFLILFLVAACDSDPQGTSDISAQADLGALDKGSKIIDEDSATPGPGCAAAKLLTLVAGQGKVSGTTQGAANEFGQAINCGTSDVHSGPQVYYRTALSASKDYVISLTPAFSRAALYVFGSSCVGTAINAACGSGGKTGAVSLGTAAGDAVQILFSPTKDGTYTIAVDSRSPAYYGTFDLELKEYPLPGNWKCIKPATLKLTGGKTLFQGTTLGGTNEFGTQITCGSTAALGGPQAYYSASLVSGKVYRMTLTPTFPAHLYAFDSTCVPSKIEASCASKGVTGDVIQVYSSASTSLYYRAGGATTIAVDSASPSYKGTFLLDLAEHQGAGNGICSGAKALSLAGGAVTVKGDTTGEPNQYGAAITCGGSQPMLGNQLYYTVSLQAGTSYPIGLTATFGSARLYIFGPACAPASIEADCKSSGKTGAVSAHIYKDKTGTLNFLPVKTGSYTIAVDSTSRTADGAFTLSIK